MTPGIIIDDDFFYGQFIFSRTDNDKLKSWRKKVFNGWFLKVHPLLNIHELKGAKGSTIGWLIGNVIDPEEGLYVDDRVIYCQEEDYTDPSKIEDFIYKFNGRFIFVSSDDRLPRVYLDAGGSLALVYSGIKKAIASTASLIKWYNDEEVIDERNPLGELKPNQFYPGSMTAFPEIDRLLPNHYLEIESFTPIRHWPTSSPEQIDEKDIGPVLYRIRENIRNIIGAVIDKYPVYMGLTSGKDTRAILACCKEYTEKITFFTFDYKSFPGVFDMKISRLIADRFKLEHLVLSIEDTGERDKKVYQVRTGYSGNYRKSRDFYQALKNHLDMNHAIVTGFAGEMTRSPYLNKFDDLRESISPEKLIRLVHVPYREPFVVPFNKWYDEVKGLNLGLILDLLYLEQRFGSWAAPHLYGIAPFKVHIIPYISREIFENLLKLPLEYRVTQAVPKDLVSLFWPELNDYPFYHFSYKPLPLRIYEMMKKKLHMS